MSWNEDLTWNWPVVSSAGGTAQISKDIWAEYVGQLSQPGGVSVLAFGAKADGVTDATAAFTAAAAYLGALGGTIYVYGKFLIDNNLTIPTNITIKGAYSFIGTTNATAYSSMSALILNSAKTITLSTGSGLYGCLLYRKGMTFPTTDSTAFAGTAITIGGDDCHIFNSMIMGFDKAIYSTGHMRIRVSKLQGDNQNGIDLINCMDISYIENVHFWPFSIYPNDGNYKRTGTAFRFYGGGDWNKVTNCFCWGYKFGYYVESCTAITFLSCGSDTPPTGIPDSIGFWVKNVDDVRFVACQAAGQVHAGYVIDSGSGTVRLIGCDSWYSGEHGILINSGDTAITGGRIRVVDNGITINHATAKVLIDQVHNTGTVKIYMAVANPYVVQGFKNEGSGWINPHEVTYDHSHYNTAYTDRLKWDGGSTGLTASTGRTSLELGSSNAPTFAGAYLTSHLYITGGAIALDNNQYHNAKDEHGNYQSLIGINDSSVLLIGASAHNGIYIGLSMTGDIQFGSNLLMLNNKQLYGAETGGTLQSLICIGDDNKCHVGVNAGAVVLGATSASANPVYLRVGGNAVKITAGANDSAVAGYRHLMVPNT